MARPLRIQIPDGWYHITTRGTERREIFTTEACYTHFLELLAAWVPRFHLRVHAYVLMPNHVHFVVSTPEANLDVAMQWLKTSYSMWFNRRTQRVGPLFQGRYKAELLEGRAAAWAVTQYIHLNPVRVQRLGLGKAERQREKRGLVTPTPEQVRERLAMLRGYRWSSYLCYIGSQTVPEWLTVDEVLTGGSGQQRAYRQAVEAAVGGDESGSVLPPVVGGLFRGSATWIDAMRRRLQGNEIEQGDFRRLAVRPGWKEIRQAIEQAKGELWEQFAERHGDDGRDVALYVLRHDGGLSLPEAARCVGLVNYHAAAQALSRLTARLSREEELRDFVDEVRKCIKV